MVNGFTAFRKGNTVDDDFSHDFRRNLLIECSLWRINDFPAILRLRIHVPESDAFSADFAGNASGATLAIAVFEELPPGCLVPARVTNGTVSVAVTSLSAPQRLPYNRDGMIPLSP